jgi:putative phosphoribosyl transferase
MKWDVHRNVEIPFGHSSLAGYLDLPRGAVGVVLCAHDSGSTWFSASNQHIARMFQGQQLGTLLIDLLTPAEANFDQRSRLRGFDISLLAARVRSAIDWMAGQHDLSGLKVGVFGASTGAAAAIAAAASHPHDVHAVVSRGDRPDLAGDALGRLRAPTLFIVGGDDAEARERNEEAQREIQAPAELAVVPGASLFDDATAWSDVARVAAKWFRKYLGGTGVQIIERASGNRP